MKQFFGKKSRNALATVLLLSLSLHVVGIFVFGTIQFVSEALREETVFEAAQIAPPPQKEPEYTVNIQQRNQSTPPPRPPAIVVNNPSELDIPALDIDVNLDSSAVFGRGGGGFGKGIAGVREMAITADLFGVSVTAEKLGVILDVSGSAHAYMIQAIEEIDRNFPDAYMILVVGCGMSDGTSVIDGAGGRGVPGMPRVVPYKDRRTEGENNNKSNSVPQQLEKFYRRIGTDRADKMKRYFERRENLYAVYGGGTFAANFAFYELLNKGVDSIYWFADFRDNCEQPQVDDLEKRLRSNRCTLIAHNFHGQGVRWNIAEMIERIGGKTIEVIPGQQ